MLPTGVSNIQRRLGPADVDPDDPADQRLAFQVDHADPHSHSVKPYVLLYYPASRHVEMVDPNRPSRRSFLRRTPVPDLSVADLVLGAAVTICGRQLLVRDYADDATRAQLVRDVVQVRISVPDRYMDSLADVLAAVARPIGAVVRGIRVVVDPPPHIGMGRRCVVVHLVASPAVTRAALRHPRPDSAAAIISASAHKEPAGASVNRGMGSGGGSGGAAARRRRSTPSTPGAAPATPPVDIDAASDSVAAVASVRRAIAKWPGVCMLDPPTMDAMLASPRPDLTDRETAGSSLMLIKPHAVLNGHVPGILADLRAAGLQCADFQSHVLARADAHDFFQVYQGILPDYTRALDELTSGTVIAIRVTGCQNIVPALRDVCGPYDPELACVISPRSLRAKYGSDKTQNAVHCTDVPDDAALECQFFFSLLEPMAGMD
ncbi:nucleoside diphosphate kinase [Blastocladiella britannica]|nr:nucleoside diphosphate kinase [Blastocladiella britannica]